jgi:hypothetical protein
MVKIGGSVLEPWQYEVTGAVESGTRSTTTIAHFGSPEPVLAIQRTRTHVVVDASTTPKVVSCDRSSRRDPGCSASSDVLTSC